MGLYKRGKNWCVDYRYPRGRHGKRIREMVGPSKEEARIVLSERLKDIRQGRNPELRQMKPVLFKDHAAEVLRRHYGTKRSLKWAEIVFNAHLVPYFGEKMLGDISAEMVTEYLTQRSEHGISNSTRNRERAVLSKALSLAIDWKLLHENPVQGVQKAEEPKGRPGFLTYEEGDRLIEAAPSHLRPVIITALETGGRRSEVLGLTWEDVDLSEGVLRFNQTNTKNAQLREIPLTPTLEALLREKSRVRAISGDARKYLFTRYGKRLTDIRTAFERARKGAGLGPQVTFHLLRHTFATWYTWRPGYDLNILRELLGHQDIKTTMIYVKTSEDRRRAARLKMGRQPGAEFGGHSVDTARPA